MKFSIHRIAIAEALPPHFSFESEQEISVGELITLLDKEYGRNVADQLTVDGKLRDGALVLVNGKSLLQLGGLALKLKDGDDLLLSVTVFGG